MKKFLLFCMLFTLTTLGVKAQLQLIDRNGNVLENGSKVTFTEPDAELLEYGVCQIPMGITLKNAGSKAVECKAKFEVLEIDTEKGKFACCAFGDCVQFNKTGAIEKGPVQIEAGGTNTSLNQTEWTPTDKTTAGMVKLRLTVYDTQDATNSTSITVTLENKDSNVAQGTERSMDFKYYDDNASAVTDLRFNTQQLQNQYMAIFVPGSYAGKKITAVKFKLVTTDGVSNVKAWASKNLPEKSESADVCESVDAPSTDNTVALSTPLTVPAEGCYVGYSFYSQGGSTASCMYWYDYPAKIAGANFRTAEDVDGWYDYSGDGYCSSLVATVTGKYADNDVVIDSSFPEVVVTKGSVAYTSLKVTNIGTSTVSSLEYSVTDASTGNVLKTAILDTHGLASGKSGNFAFDLGATDALELTRRMVTVTKVNGEKIDASDYVVSVGTVKVLSQFYPRRVVVEEGTGTWCGYCPRGIVGMEKMYEEFPDNFIGIAVHDDDEMRIGENYINLLYNFSGLPACIANRQEKYNTDPNEYSLREIISAEKDRGEAQIEAKAFWKDDSKNEVTVTTTSRFAYSGNNADIKIAYAVTEDGVGPYMQANYYNGGGLEGWQGKGNYVSTTYNDVARGIYDYNGVAGSVPAAINVDENYNYEYTFSLPTNVTNKDNVNIIVLLINGENGEIMNADKVKPQVGTGINAAVADSDINVYVRQGKLVTDVNGCVLKVFNTAGREVANEELPSGMYIVKAVVGGRNMVRKVVVK